jgi:hypothetical protein
MLRHGSLQSADWRRPGGRRHSELMQLVVSVPGEVGRASRDLRSRIDVLAELALELRPPCGPGGRWVWASCAASTFPFAFVGVLRSPPMQDPQHTCHQDEVQGCTSHNRKDRGGHCA